MWNNIVLSSVRSCGLHSLSGNFAGNAQDIYLGPWVYLFNITTASCRGQWVKSCYMRVTNHWHIIYILLICFFFPNSQWTYMVVYCVCLYPYTFGNRKARGCCRSGIRYPSSFWLTSSYPQCQRTSITTSVDCFRAHGMNYWRAQGLRRQQPCCYSSLNLNCSTCCNAFLIHWFSSATKLLPFPYKVPITNF